MRTRPLVFSSGKGMRRCLRRGVGIALCPERTVADDLASGRLVRVNWPYAPGETMILMLTHVEKWRSPLLERFMDMAGEAVMSA